MQSQEVADRIREAGYQPIRDYLNNPNWPPLIGYSKITFASVKNERKNILERFRDWLYRAMGG